MKISYVHCWTNNPLNIKVLDRWNNISNSLFKKYKNNSHNLSIYHIMCGDGKWSNEIKEKYPLYNFINETDSNDNISYLNPYLNEATMLYYIWKNWDKIGNPDYIVVGHYRRVLNVQIDKINRNNIFVVRTIPFKSFKTIKYRSIPYFQNEYHILNNNLYYHFLKNVLNEKYCVPTGNMISYYKNDFYEYMKNMILYINTIHKIYKEKIFKKIKMINGVHGMRYYGYMFEYLSGIYNEYISIYENKKMIKVGCKLLITKNNMDV